MPEGFPAPMGQGLSQFTYCEQGHYVADSQRRCLEGHELPKEVSPDGSPTVVSPPPPFVEKENGMAEYNQTDSGVIVKDGSYRDRSFEAALIASGDDAGRDVADAGRDLAMEGSDAARDLTAAVADANRDLVSAVADAGRDLSSALHDSHRDRDLTEQVGRVERVVVEQAKDNVIVTGREGSRGRETTLEAKSDLMKEHCETQKLVLQEGSLTREAVHAEAEKTRELVRDEHRALLQRELDAKSEENTLLKLQINLLSSGTGPLNR